MTSLDKSWQVLTSLKSCILPIAHVNPCDTLAWWNCPKYTWVTCCHVLSCFFAGSAGAPLGDFPFFRCCVAGRSIHWIHAIGLQDKDGVVSQNDFMIFMKDTGCLCRNRLATVVNVDISHTHTNSIWDQLHWETHEKVSEALTVCGDEDSWEVRGLRFTIKGIKGPKGCQDVTVSKCQHNGCFGPIFFTFQADTTVIRPSFCSKFYFEADHIWPGL